MDESIYTTVKCKTCKACCCKQMWFQLDPNPKVEHARWAKLHGLEVIDRLGVQYAVVPIKCKMLENNKCTIYDDRPQICKDYICTDWEQEYLCK